MKTNIKRVELDEQQKRALVGLICNKYYQGALCGVCAMCQEYELTEEPCECTVSVDGFKAFVEQKKPADCPAKRYLANEHGIENRADLQEQLGTDYLETIFLGTLKTALDPAFIDEGREK